MKSYLAFIALISLFCTASAHAETNVGASERTVLNKVKIINSTSKDIGYMIISASTNADNLYAVKAKKTDTYHAKATGDVNATIKVAACNKINKVTGICSEYNADTVMNCVSEARYDFYKVKSVNISSLNSCVITCNDGGDSSCVVR